MKSRTRLIGDTSSRGVMMIGLVLLFGFLAGPLHQAVGAGKMYTYVDEKGTVVVTDNLKNIPKRFRSKVSVREVPDLPRQDSRAVEFLEAAGEATMKNWMDYLPDTILEGFTKQQSILLIAGFAGSIVAFGIMTMSRSPSVKFAMKWVLMFVAVGVFYALYFSELKTTATTLGGGSEELTRPATIMDRVKSKASEVEALEQRKADELDRIAR